MRGLDSLPFHAVRSGHVIRAAGQPADPYRLWKGNRLIRRSFPGFRLRHPRRVRSLQRKQLRGFLLAEASDGSIA